MGDGRGEGARPQAQIGDKAEADAAGGVVPLDHGDLGQVAIGVGDQAPLPDHRPAAPAARQQLAGNDPDRPDVGPAVAGDGQHVEAERPDVHRLPDPLRRAAEGEPRLAAALQHRPGHEVAEVVEEEQVGLPAGGDRAQMPEAVVFGGMEGGHDQRLLGGDPLGDGDPQHLVEVALLGQRGRLAVVGAEHAALRPVAPDHGQQVAQVPRVGRLAEHHPHAQPALLQRLLQRGRLVVGADAGGDVGVEGVAGEAGRVAVDVLGEPGLELAQLGGVAGDDGGEVHHLGHAQRPPAPEQALQVAPPQPAARRLVGGGGHAGGGHDEDVEVDGIGGVDQPVHAVGAEDVGDLVRVGDDGGRALRDHRLGEPVRGQLRRLDVEMGIDEAGNDVGAGDVAPLPASVGAEPDDGALGDGDVDLEPLAGEDGKHPAPGEDQITGLVPSRHRQQLGIDGNEG